MRSSSDWGMASNVHNAGLKGNEIGLAWTPAGLKSAINQLRASEKPPFVVGASIKRFDHYRSANGMNFISCNCFDQFPEKAGGLAVTPSPIRAYSLPQFVECPKLLGRNSGTL